MKYNEKAENLSARERNLSDIMPEGLAIASAMSGGWYGVRISRDTACPLCGSSENIRLEE